MNSWLRLGWELMKRELWDIQGQGQSMERYEQCRQTAEEGLQQKIDLSGEVSDEEVRKCLMNGHSLFQTVCSFFPKGQTAAGAWDL